MGLKFEPLLISVMLVYAFCYFGTKYYDPIGIVMVFALIGVISSVLTISNGLHALNRRAKKNLDHRKQLLEQELTDQKMNLRENQDIIVV